LAKTKLQNPGSNSVKERGSHGALRSNLPASSSELPIAQTIAILHKWGIHTLGQLAALDKEELRNRLGADAVGLWERANGTATRLLKFVQPPETFEESFEFDHEIETAEPLLFMLRRFLEQLSLRLSSIYLVARELTLTIKFSDSRQGEPTNASAARTYERVFKIPQPTNDVDLLFRMLQTHLENFKSEHPIVAVALTAQPIRPASQQFGLFETALRNPHQLYETLARLSALLGNDRVGTPVLEETHRPDAFRMEPFSWASVESAVPSGNPKDALRTAHTTTRPALRRFRPPANKSLFVSDKRYLESDKIRGQIVDQSGPFLFSGNWWDEKSWARAEWDMQLENGDLIRAHEDSGAWKIDGIYD
jgi:nucleotidyltransferase/DNA polymerase involved in DNA repair